MPHRIIPPTWFLHAVEGISLSALSFIAFISEQDWSRMLGPHGVAVVAILAVVALWVSGIKEKSAMKKDIEAREAREEARRTKEEESREKRHNESIQLQTTNSDKLVALTVENIKAQALTTAALASVDRSLQDLAEQISKCPGKQ
jgi:FtsZ-interacting cell division protein ZipA